MLCTIRPPLAAMAGLIAACAAVATPTPDAGGALGTKPYSYIHHPVSTRNAAAQSAFDRGLTMVFAYQPEEAEQSFRQAARLDPALAMAWWGIGLSLGPDINDAPTSGKTAKAAEAVAKARGLAAAHGSEVERRYIAALATRYSSDPHPDFDRLAVAYRDGMRALVQAYPQDADARALFAEAIMDLHPWRLWNAGGSPQSGTEELVRTLEKGLKSQPDHIGLLHFYIHAVEGSSDPGRALFAARRLAALPMEPAAAHLVHMPAHIYMRVGDWEAAVEANEHATRHALDYRRNRNPATQRACGHCADFLSYAYMMQGSLTHAHKSAEDYAKLTDDPTNLLAVLVRFRQWQELLVFPEPGSGPKTSLRDPHAVEGLWHFARGMAHVGTGNLAAAEMELAAVGSAIRGAPGIAHFDGPLDVAHVQEKTSQTIDSADLQIAAAILSSRLAEANGAISGAIEQMRHAVRLQDELPYNEPPPWFYPVRESLGGVLLRSESPVEAEAVFREDLRRSPENPRSLLGLAAALDAQGKSSAADETRRRFEAAWRYSDVQALVADL